MEKFPRSVRVIFEVLKNQHKYFLRKGSITDDGSFYTTHKWLSEKFHYSKRTISRAIKILSDLKYIKTDRDGFKGKATNYCVARRKLPVVSLNLYQQIC